jgi:fumarylacetoacetate (FAA) hydrolase family protein
MPRLMLQPEGNHVGRVWRPGIGPSLVQIRGSRVVDITTRAAPTMSDLLEIDDVTKFAAAIEGEVLCTLDELAVGSFEATEHVLHILAPCDLQAIKAAGVTFARSMIERVIEERAKGDISKANEIRAQIADIIGGSLKNLVPGSPRAEEVKAVLVSEGLWSQYLEVGIGPYAEVFTKSQPMSAVGFGAKVGLHPVSTWNNPEPEIVMAVNGKGKVQGCTLGNDVNLRDVEGRSALLLGKAKDNNASASIGPFIRLFDDHFSMSDIECAIIKLSIKGSDGFELTANCSMEEISRRPLDIVEQTYGDHHQYPDGFVLYLGSMFAPVQDRDGQGQGFTHHVGDVVDISTPLLGRLTNTVALSTECPRWVFGASALLRNLAGRKLV